MMRHHGDGLGRTGPGEPMFETFETVLRAMGFERRSDDPLVAAVEDALQPEVLEWTQGGAAAEGRTPVVPSQLGEATR